MIIGAKISNKNVNELVWKKNIKVIKYLHYIAERIKPDYIKI